MTHTTLNANDSGPTSRAVINANFAANDVSIDSKIEYSGTVPAIGDLVVAAATDGLSIKKKVFTASQVLESDSNGQPTSAAKGTAYNKNYGTSSGTTLEGSNDALYTKLAGTQTITGDKTFSGTVAFGTLTTGVTQTPANNSTKLATTAYVDAAASTILAWADGNTTKNSADASATQNIAHGLGRVPKFAEIIAVHVTGTTDYIQMRSETAYNGTTQSSISFLKSATGSGNSFLSTAFKLNAASTGDSAFSTGVVTFDSTNLIITWTKTGGPTGEYTILWKAYG